MINPRIGISTLPIPTVHFSPSVTAGCAPGVGAMGLLTTCGGAPVGSAVAQLPQNFAKSGFSEPHFGQYIGFHEHYHSFRRLNNPETALAFTEFIGLNGRGAFAHHGNVAGGSRAGYGAKQGAIRRKLGFEQRRLF